MKANIISKTHLLYNCMNSCKLCGKRVPCKAWIDGKKRSLKNRRYCFDCSPFGSRNTRNLTKAKKEGNLYERICVVCHLPIPDGTKNGRRCYPCVQREREKDSQNKVYGMVGTACWVCGYDKGMKGTGVLDFHHMNPDDKIFGLDKRNTTNFSWERVVLEMKKCVVLCARCHREQQCGILENEQLFTLHKSRWAEITEHR